MKNCQYSQYSAMQYLSQFNKLYPDITKQVNVFRGAMGKDLPKWPEWCFLPMAAWYSIVSAQHELNRLPPDLVGDVAKLASIGTWRFSQGIYTIEPHLLEALVNSPISGDLPSDLFFQMPEWCIYVDLSNYGSNFDYWGAGTINGFWVHLEHDIKSSRAELRFLLDCQHDVVVLPLHIGKWSVLEAVRKTAVEINKYSKIKAISEEEILDMADKIMPFVSIVLYLCSEEPEIDDRRVPMSRPARSRPQKTKKGFKFFPADKPRFWDVGVSIGHQLANSYADASVELTGRSVKTHLRRGHWHGYWKGARSGERKFIYRWISPLVVKPGV